MTKGTHVAEATLQTETVERTTVTLTMTIEEAEALSAMASRADNLEGAFGDLVRPVYYALDEPLGEHPGSVHRMIDHYRRLNLEYRYDSLL
jgi:hypothetical protein